MAGVGDTFMIERDIAMLLERLDRIEAAVLELTRQRQVKDFYSAEEYAALVERAPFTVREWARHHRTRAGKRRSGRGRHPEWVISRDELCRFRREGLLPLNETPGPSP